MSRLTLNRQLPGSSADVSDHIIAPPPLAPAALPCLPTHVLLFVVSTVSHINMHDEVNSTRYDRRSAERTPTSYLSLVFYESLDPVPAWDNRLDMYVRSED